MPSIAAPAALDEGRGQVFPAHSCGRCPSTSRSTVPSDVAWHRFEQTLTSQAANQAILTWATCGGLIGLAMRPHQDTVRIQDAHASVSAGVIAHTMHFLERIDASQWLLVQQVATKAANGRAYGRGSVFTEDGTLVATFDQDSMLKATAAPIDGRRGMSDRPPPSARIRCGQRLWWISSGIPDEIDHRRCQNSRCSLVRPRRIHVGS